MYWMGWVFLAGFVFWFIVAYRYRDKYYEERDAYDDLLRDFNELWRKQQ